MVVSGALFVVLVIPRGSGGNNSRSFFLPELSPITDSYHTDNQIIKYRHPSTTCRKKTPKHRVMTWPVFLVSSFTSLLFTRPQHGYCAQEDSRGKNRLCMLLDSWLCWPLSRQVSLLVFAHLYTLLIAPLLSFVILLNLPRGCLFYYSISCSS